MTESILISSNVFQVYWFSTVKILAGQIICLGIKILNIKLNRANGIIKLRFSTLENPATVTKNFEET